MDGLKLAYVVVFLLLTACGGGGGGGGSSSPPTNPPPGGGTVALSGKIEKGPFVAGERVTVSSVSARGAIGGQLATTTTSNDLGTFSLSINPSQTVLVNGRGSFLDETDGTVSSDTLSLDAVVQVSSAASQSANVNILTHLAAPRFLALMQGGSSAASADTQSRDDLLAAITDIVAPPSITSLKGASLYSQTQGDLESAYLVTLSAFFVDRAHQLAEQKGTEVYAELQELIDAVARDLADGVIDFSDALVGVRDMAYSVNPEVVASNLADLATAQGSSEFAGDIYLYLDSDLDGILNGEDDDDDGDGVADADDAYPLDWSCYLEADGDGTKCTIDSSLPATFSARDVEIDNNGVVYLLDGDAQQIFRWSISRQQYGFPIDVPFGTETIEYSNTFDRVFAGISTGEVLAIEPFGEHAVSTFIDVGARVRRMSEAGNYLVVADSLGNWYTVAADGSIAAQRYRVADNSLDTLGWVPATNQLFSLEWPTSPAFEYVVVDQQTGAFGTAQSAPDSNNFYLRGRLNASVDGARIATASGAIFSTDTFEWQRTIPMSGSIGDVAWLDDHSTALIHSDTSSSTNTTRYERRSSRGDLIEYASFPGWPARIINYEGRVVVVTVDSRPVFNVFAPGGDADNDGTANPEDAFPFDPAAALDSDRDGHPDDWNAGKSQLDSTTGLTRDAYPFDSACHEDFHGDGTTCDIASWVFSFLPLWTDVDRDGVVYMLDTDNERVTRWDVTNGIRNPLPYGDGFRDVVYFMRYSPEQHRLYLGYLDGEITYFDLEDPGEEIYFASAPTAQAGMQPAGNYVLSAGPNGGDTGRYSVTFDLDGNVASRVQHGEMRRDSTWDPVQGRVYLIDDPGRQTEIQYVTVDQGTGQVGALVDSPYEISDKVFGPVRVSPDGSQILLKSGDIYSATDLSRTGGITPGFHDAQWGDDGEVVAVRTLSDALANARVERRTTDGSVLQLAFAGGSPVALHRDNGDFRLITLANSGLLYFRFQAVDDVDGDGVENFLDAFPTDASASVDGDWDGHPDAWNEGMSEADSSTGLTLDAYPDDAACNLEEQGDGTVCDILSTIPDYIPDSVDIDDQGIVHLYSWWNRRIYRWDAVTQQHLNPYVIAQDRWQGDGLPTDMFYHPTHKRIYVGYADNHLKYIDPAAGPEENYFTVLSYAHFGLGDAGNFLLTIDEDGGSEQHKVFDLDGQVRDTDPGDRTLDFTWDPILERIYFFDGVGTSNRLMYKTIDQATGEILGEDDSPYFGDYESRNPIRVSADGTRIITGAADLYDQQFLYRTGSLPGDFADARWLADGGIVTVRAAANDSGDTSYERRNSSGDLVEARRITGAPLAIVPFRDDFVIVTDEGTPSFALHAPSDDTDGDGVDNILDAFPLDPAASADTDGDGFPDTWNAGTTEADSTTGLSLDAYASDSACQLDAHGDGVNCDIASTIPDYSADEIAIDESGVVYLFSSSNQRVYRWDANTQQHLNPIIVGSAQWVDATAPTIMTYHPGHARLYFGYEDSDITFVNIAGGGEHRLASLSLPVGGLSNAGTYLMAFGREDVEGIANVLDDVGELSFNRFTTYWSSAYAWNDSQDRLYHLRDEYENNYLMAMVVNQTTGRLNGTAEPSNDGSLAFNSPIRVSTDGNNVLVGGGNIFDGLDLTLQASLGQAVIDGAWMNDGRLVTARPDGADTIVEVLDVSYQILSELSVPNAPTAMLPYGNDVVVVTSSGQPEFTVVTP